MSFLPKNVEIQWRMWLWRNYRNTNESTGTLDSEDDEGCGCGTGTPESSDGENGGCSCGCGGDYPDEFVVNNPSEPKTMADEDFIAKIRKIRSFHWY